MKFFTLFIIFNLSSLTFVQAEGIVKIPEVLQAETSEVVKASEVLQTENLEAYPREVLDAETSVWKIYNNESDGTGFFISPNRFVTNFHVLHGLLRDTENLNDIHLSQKGNPNTLSIKKVVAVSTLYDLVLIETKETFQHYLNLSQNKIKTDEDLFVIGYPAGIFKKMKKVGEINYENDHFFSFPVNHSEFEGASGSPVLNNQGQVVGVLSRGDVNLMFAIKINYLTDFIPEA